MGVGKKKDKIYSRKICCPKSLLGPLGWFRFPSPKCVPF